MLISKTHILKLCDFGFARLLNNQVTMTDYVATRWYRAPELLVGCNYSMPIDIWAIGCIMGELIDGQPLFPGESEFDQLYCIEKVMGPLIPEHKEALMKNPHFLGLRLPEILKFESLEKKYMGKINKIGLAFMKSLLSLNPDDRITASQALSHPYFDMFRDENLRNHSVVGPEKIGNIYQNKHIGSIAKKNTGSNPGTTAGKNEGNEYVFKSRPSVLAFENNDVERVDNRKELQTRQGVEEAKSKFAMFHISEETESRTRTKSLKKKLKMNDNKYQNKYPKGKQNEYFDVEVASGYGSNKQLPLINHHHNFDLIQKRID